MPPSRKRPTATASATDAPRLTGKVVLAPTSRVKPNDWNPNRMTEFQMETTRDGFRRHGWITAYALLVWGTDEKGKRRDVIIDGEHRWRVADELGIKEGPMVFLDGLTQKQAMELTVEMDNKRGAFDPTALGDVLRKIGVDDGLAMRLGFDDETFKRLLDQPPVLPPDDFRDVTIDATTQYCCPKCGYEWSGQSASKKDKGKKGSKK